ncbi:MAG: nucleotide excision repair endonuclease, partial [Roseimicrobium sp.]
MTNPITTRLGPEAFTNLPRCPGVYFFYDATGRLLYIGQSLNLRARVTSYRHVSPERHPRRTLRLVHRIARIDWQTCDTPEAAIELERTLLLQHRPPFNRAGTWQAPPWYLHIRTTEDHLHLSLIRPEAATPAPALTADPKIAEALAPHPLLELPSFGLQSQPSPPQSTSSAPASPISLPRNIHATLCRCLIRLHHPELPLSHYPAGLLNLTAPLNLRLHFPGQAPEVARLLTDYLSGRTDPLLGALRPLADQASLMDAGGTVEEPP